LHTENHLGSFCTKIWDTNNGFLPTWNVNELFNSVGYILIHIIQTYSSKKLNTIYIQ